MTSFKQLNRQIRETDSYWIESAKLNFAIGLGDLMETAQLSRTDFAAKLGTSPAYISKIFRGDVNFTIESMVKLVRSLGGRLHLKVASAAEEFQFVRTTPVQSIHYAATRFSSPIWAAFEVSIQAGELAEQAINDDAYELQAAA